MNTPFKDFWEASNLSAKTIKQYAKRMSAYDADTKNLKLEYPGKSTPIKRKRSKLSKLNEKRSSSRDFSDDYISNSDLELLLQQFSTLNGDLEHRTYPSAGATYSVETFFFDLINNIVGYYDAENNGIQIIQKLNLSKDKLNNLLNVQYSGQPSLVILFVGFSDRVVAKYGERGNRFMLLEAGAMLQQVALGIAENKNICGCAIGGLLDDEILELLELQNDNAVLLTGYVVGKKLKTN